MLGKNLIHKHDKSLSDFSILNAPEGFLINGKIAVSLVSTDHLVVSIKGMDGNDPSATNPVYLRIDDTIVSITAALTMTLADGTNWCNAGSAELAGKEIDYFVYLGATGIGISRIPYGRLYSDFSGTATNEKYLATYTGYNAGDSLVNVGRFAATLSATNDWTIPTFTSANLIQRPIYETRWLTWAPTFTGFSSVMEGNFYYKIIGKQMYINTITTVHGTSNATTFTATLPIASITNIRIICQVRDNSEYLTNPGIALVSATPNILNVYKTCAQNNWTDSGTKSFNLNALVPIVDNT